jgi:hypothetical protein
MASIDKAADIFQIFTYHPPKADQLSRYERIRSQAREFAMVLLETCPHSAERTLAVRRLQECVMMANASIAINE